MKKKGRNNFFVTVFEFYVWLSLWLLSVKCNQFFWGRDGSNHFLLHLPIRFFFLHRSYTNMRVVVQIGSCKSLVLFLCSILLICSYEIRGDHHCQYLTFWPWFVLAEKWMPYLDWKLRTSRLRIYQRPFSIWSHWSRFLLLIAPS